MPGEGSQDLHEKINPAPGVGTSGRGSSGLWDETAVISALQGLRLIQDDLVAYKSVAYCQKCQMGLLFGYAAFDDNANIVINSRVGFLCGDIFQVDIVGDVDDVIFHVGIL